MIHRSILRASFSAIVLIAAGLNAQTPHTIGELNARAVNTGFEVGSLPGASSASGTGGAQYSIPIEVTPGTNGVQPQLALAYDSQRGNGLLGMGWALAGTSTINRTGKDHYHDGDVQAFDYGADDRFELDGQRLVLTSGTYGALGSTYDTETASFSKVELLSVAGNDQRFFYLKVTSKDGSTSHYGLGWNDKVLSRDGSKVISWRLTRVTDPYGNYMVFNYAPNPDPQMKESELMSIAYTGNELAGTTPFAHVDFSYQDRTDMLTQYVAGVAFRRSKLLAKVEVFSGADLVRRYELSYAFRDGRASYLNDVKLVGEDGIHAFNPTMFAYGNVPQTGVSETQVNLQQPGQFDVFTGDYDGNGIGDLLIAEITYDYGTRFHSVLKLYMNGSTLASPDWQYAMPPLSTVQAGIGYQPNISWGSVFGDQVGSPMHTYEVALPNDRSIAMHDYNGDGRDDIMLTSIVWEQSAVVQSPAADEWERIDGAGAWRLGSFALLTSNCTSTQTSFNDPVDHAAPSALPYFKSPGRFMTVGDFDADGKMEAMVIFNDLNIALNSQTFLFGEEGWTALETTVQTRSVISTLDAMNVGDFDGDGRHELMLFRDDTQNSRTFHALRLTQDAHLVETRSGTFNHTYAPNDFRLWPADFNGDGITDYLARTASGFKTVTGWSPRSVQSVYYDDAPFVFDVPFTDDHDIVVADLDGNGMTDILHRYALEGTPKMRTYFAYGQDVNGPLFHAPPAFNTISASNVLTVGDHDGDGRMDVISSNDYSPTITYTRFNQGAFERQLALVSDGFCNRTVFDYLNHHNQPSILPAYPLIVPGTLGPIVHRINYFIGIQAPLATSYSFSKPRRHVLGRGFLGFLQIEKDVIGVERTMSISTVGAPYFIPMVQDVFKISPDWTPLSHTNSVYELSAIGATSNKHVYTKLLSTSVTDQLTGATTLTENVWDLHGNITYTANAVNGTLHKEEAFLSYDAYGPAQVRNRLVRSTTLSSREGQQALSKTTEHEYDVQGGLVSTTDHVGRSLVVHTRLERNAFGLIRKSTTSAPSMPAEERATQFAYDANGRFLLTKIVWLDENGTQVPVVEKYTYDERWGVVKSTLGADGLTTLHTHDWFGRQQETQIPHIAGALRHAITIERHWALDPSTGQVHMQRVVEPSAPRIEEYFDAAGRVLRKAVEVNGPLQWSETTSTYDDLGRLKSQTEPHLDGEEPFSILYTYNEGLGYLEQELNSFSGATSHTYAYPGNGVVTHTVTAPGSRTGSSTTDATGAVTEAHDDGGDLVYTYDSWGAQTKVTLNNTTIAWMEYDEYGRQTRLYDQNAGITKYEYDAFGQLIHMTDAVGNETTYIYDNLGRPTERVEVEGNTHWDYYHVGSKVTNAPVRIVSPDHEVQFQYNDPYLRLTKRMDIVDGTTYTHGYAMDDNDRVTHETYPSGITVAYTYGTIGQLGEVLYDGAPLFSGGRQDGCGRYTKYQLGTLPITKRTYDHGLPTRMVTEGLQDLEMRWESGTADLTSRWDRRHELKETFEYDALDRLISNSALSVDMYGNTVAIISGNHFVYDGTTGQSRGNLEVKEDIGIMKYYANRPYGAYNINYPTPPADPPSVISLETQAITYTSFHKAGAMTEVVDGQGYDLSYTYGVDHERITGVLSVQGTPQETRTYVGNYEKQVLGSNTRELHYVSGGDGLCAILVTTNGVTKPYVVFKDHLGSIVSVVHNTGTTWTTVAEQSFDAWGRRRNSANWTYQQLDQLPSWLYRGYTGHEHVEPFALINMNGRMYDPVNGRMLSADNYVNGTSASQAFNRYSYAANNPLKYTDPTGDFIWIIPNFGWSKQGGFTGGVSFVFGMPGVLSVQAGFGYNLASNTGQFYVGATAAFNTISASLSTNGDFSLGYSVGASPYSGLPISTNFLSASVNWSVTQNSWSGNLSAWQIDQNGWSFNPSVSVMLFPEQTTNLARGKGFRSNDAVLSRFVASGDQQGALNYFGFQGTYDPTKKNPGETDVTTGAISYSAAAFTSYDRLFAVADHEAYHRRSVMSGKYEKFNGDIPFDVAALEEYGAYMYGYRRQGFYGQSGTPFAARLQYYGGNAGLSQYHGGAFSPPAWHVIYRIPRVY